MNAEIVESKVKCPKCKSVNLTLIELWRNNSIEWEQTDGKFNRRDGNIEPGDPYKVEAKCECGHRWSIRGALQIGDIQK